MNEYTIIIKTKEKLDKHHINDLKMNLEYSLYSDYDIKIEVKNFFLSKFKIKL